MKILVTGASGFVGQHLAKGLLKEDHQVTAFVCKNDLSFSDPGLKQIKVDLLKSTGWQNELEGIEIVIHLVGLFRGGTADLVNVNTITTVNILQASVKAGVKRFVFAATGAAYGEPIDGKPFIEEAPLQPDTIYGLTKMWGEEAVDYFARVHGLTGITLRFPNIYGPGNTANVIFKFLQSIQKKGEVTILGDGLQERDFLYINDAVEGFLKALSYNQSGIFNLSGGKTASLLAVLGLIEELLGRKVPIEFRPAEAGIVSNLWLDSSKAQGILAWSAKTIFRKGLEETIKWYQETYGEI